MPQSLSIGAANHKLISNNDLIQNQNAVSLDHEDPQPV